MHLFISKTDGMPVGAERKGETETWRGRFRKMPLACGENVTVSLDEEPHCMAQVRDALQQMHQASITKPSPAGECRPHLSLLGHVSY